MPLRFGLAVLLLVASSCLLASSGCSQAERWAQGPVRGDDAAQVVLGVVELRDTFGRAVRDSAVQLLDWEGPIANPAIRFVVVAPPARDATSGDRYPLRVELSAASPRLMFDTFSTVGPDGPRKTLFLDRPAAQGEFYMSVFGDRDGVNDVDFLQIVVTDSIGTVTRLSHPIFVLDQDRERPLEFAVHLDFSHDQTGILERPEVRDVVRQAADDWAYYLADMRLAAVPAGAERAWVWSPAGFVPDGAYEVTNRDAYTGYWMLVHGVRGAERRSGGAASDRCGACVQVADGRPTGLRRSGTVSIETEGNWTGRGWEVNVDPESWWRCGNADADPHDLLSILTHEIGHALAFHKVHPGYARCARARAGPELLRFEERRVREHLGFDPSVNTVEHFVGLVDPTSRTGVFGNEYGGFMPKRRWQITKTALLLAQAVGYELRDTTPFTPLRLDAPAVVHLTRGEKAEVRLRASGGVPLYCFRVADGSLPRGLELNSRSGLIAGTPVEAGRFEVEFELRDNDAREPATRARVRLVVR